MSTNINKTSIAATISGFVDDLEDHILNSNEAITETPSSFIGLLSGTLGKINAYTYYNMLMSKREIQPSTAILLKSLLRHLKSDDLADIYATPATLTFVVSYNEADIIKAAVATGNGDYKLTLNKGTVFNVGDKPTFTLDYNIDIYVSKYTIGGEERTSIYAKYNTDDAETGSIFSFVVSNPFITTRNDVVSNGNKLFTMYINTKQYERTYYNYEMSGENQNLKFTYSNNLIGFVVLYKGASDTSYTEKKAYLEGETFTDGVSYSIIKNESGSTVTIKFSKLPDAFNPTNGKILIVVYTTSGEDGNFSFDATDENVDNADLNVTFAQDVGDPYQEALVNLVPYGTLDDCKATGGKDAKTIEEIRALVTSDTSSYYIAPNALEKAAAKYGLSTFKFRQDLLAFEYIVSSYMSDSNGYIIPTKMIDATYLYSEIALNAETSSRMITPSDVFEYDAETKAYKYLPFKSLGSYSDYYSNYKLNKVIDFSFPYFLRIQNGTDISVKAYDESVDYTSATKFKYLSTVLLDKASVISANVYRNPLDISVKSKTTTETKYNKDFYKVMFTVNTSSTMVSHLKSLSASDTPYMKLKLILKNTSDTTKYITDVELSNCTFDVQSGTIDCTVYLETSSMLLSTNKIGIINNSISKLPYSSAPYSFYYVDGTVDMEIAVLFKQTESSSTAEASTYDDYMTSAEKSSSYYMAAVYEITNISLSKDMSNYINIVPDVKITQPTYKTATADIADTYSSIEYKTSNGKYVTKAVTTVLADGTKSTRDEYVVLHNAGDIKKEYDGRVGTYNVLNSSSNWTWSDESSTSASGIYNDGSVLDNDPIYAVIQYKGLVIFAGKDGRVGCFDYKGGQTWYEYNTSTIYRSGDYSKLPVIHNDGTAMGGESIRGMKIVTTTIENEAKDILIVYGDAGRVACCDLSSNGWCTYNGTSGLTSIAKYFNNGTAMGYSVVSKVDGDSTSSTTVWNSIYAAETYTASNGHTIIVFAGANGHVCSLDVTDNIWYAYNYSKAPTSNIHPFSSGAATEYKAIYTISKYLDSILYMAGDSGEIGTLDITTGNFANMNTGAIMGNATIYASAIINGILIVAGKYGRVSNYSISKNTWTIYSQGSGLVDDGTNTGGDIYAIIGYDVNVMFGGVDGHVSSYDLTSNVWTSYSAMSGLRNSGDFIKNTISAISFDSTESNIIYFAGNTGNIVYAYKKGDILKDSNGNYIVAIPSQQIGYLKRIPAYCRIYAVSSQYANVKSSYEKLITNTSSLASKFPGGCSLYCGVKTTSGASNAFSFLNLVTGETTTLDSLEISIKLGVKFSSSVTDANKTYLVSSIKSKIIAYIANLQTDTSSATLTLSIDKMLNSIKSDVPNIEYFEYYSLNNYDSSILQTINYTKANNPAISSEYLSIKNAIDEANSDLSTQSIVFVPDITITIL